MFKSPRVLWLAAATMIVCGMGFGTVLTFVPTFVQVTGLERVAPFFLSYSLAAIGVRLVLAASRTVSAGGRCCFRRWRFSASPSRRSDRSAAFPR